MKKSKIEKSKIEKETTENKDIVSKQQLIIENGRAGFYTVIENVQTFDKNKLQYVYENIRNVNPMKSIALESFEEVMLNKDGEPIYNWSEGFTLQNLKDLVANLEELVETKTITFNEKFKDVDSNGNTIYRSVSSQKVVQFFKPEILNADSNSESEIIKSVDVDDVILASETTISEKE
jgi:hypothetical protein